MVDDADDEKEIEPEIVDEHEFASQTAQSFTKRRRKSSENMAIITEQIVSVKSWCAAFCEVMNVIDVCNDAKKHFFVKTADECVDEEKTYEHPQSNNKMQSMLNTTLLR
jgi:hypothetical protein